MPSHISKNCLVNLTIWQLINAKKTEKLFSAFFMLVFSFLVLGKDLFSWPVWLFGLNLFHALCYGIFYAFDDYVAFAMAHNFEYIFMFISCSFPCPHSHLLSQTECHIQSMQARNTQKICIGATTPNECSCFHFYVGLGACHSTVDLDQDNVLFYAILLLRKITDFKRT